MFRQPRVLVLLVSAVLDIVSGRAVLAQPTRTLLGTVRTKAGAPLADAMVESAAHSARTDSLGRFVLVGISGSHARVLVRRMGFERLDTTIVFRAGQPTRLDAALEAERSPEALFRDEAAAEAKNGAAGRVDSSALGLLPPPAAASHPFLTFSVFGARLLASQALVAGDSNVVVSPVSAGLALSLALLGARAGTAVGLAKALGTEALDRQELEQRGAVFLAAVRGRTDVQLDISTALWVDQSVQLMPGFATSAAAWRATMSSLRLASPEVLSPINRWADSVTHGKIPRIRADPLPNGSGLFLTNAVYFKGKWLEPFEKSETAPRGFTLASGTQIRVPMMDQTGSMAYRRESGYRMVRRPYRGGRTAMYLILPDSGIALGAIERQFAERGWPASLAVNDMRPVHLVLPKLHVEQTNDLRPLLDSLGAGIAFDCGNADFGNLAISREGDALCLSAASQQVYLDVDEEGTEAAAITSLEVGVTSAPPPPIPFILDHPFLFLLRDEVTGADLFVGSIMRP